MALSGQNPSSRERTAYGRSTRKRPPENVLSFVNRHLRGESGSFSRNWIDGLRIPRPVLVEMRNFSTRGEHFRFGHYRTIIDRYLPMTFKMRVPEYRRSHGEQHRSSDVSTYRRGVSTTASSLGATSVKLRRVERGLAVTGRYSRRCSPVRRRVGRLRPIHRKKETEPRPESGQSPSSTSLLSSRGR